MRIRIRGPSGASALNLKDDATVGDLRSQIKEIMSLNRFDIKYGYPPKPLYLDKDTTKLSELEVRLDGEQLTIGAQENLLNERGPIAVDGGSRQAANFAAGEPAAEKGMGSSDSPSVSFAGLIGSSKSTDMRSSNNDNSMAPIALNRKAKEMEVPELPLPERGSTLVLRVMPDDNSCLFRAFGAAVLPGDDLSMTELRSLVASRIQAEPNVFTQVVLEQKPDDYCRWIQTEDAWGGAIEMGILAEHFNIEICSVDVQSLRVDRFNEGSATRCILCYSGVHYDTIVQSPSDPPHTKANLPPELDNRIWESSDEEIVTKATELCKKLQEQHYYTDTGGMAIRCTICGWVGFGQAQAQTHAQQTGHYDMTEVTT